jgi:hypothetical protein
MEYEIGGKYFLSKKAVAQCAQKILRDSEPGQVLSGEDKEFIIGLICCHPNATEKIGVGIKHIISRVDPVWKKGKQFLIIRTDGSVIDFSYRKCVYGEMSPLDFFRAACRTAVADDIISFKNKHLTPESTCPYFGFPLTKDNSHVDHVKPRTFNWLVSSFINDTGYDISTIEIIGDIQKRFANQFHAANFKDYHDKWANLELVSEQANQTCCKIKFKGEINEHQRNA